MRYEIRQSDEPLFDFLEQLAGAGIEPYPIQEQAMLEWAECDGGLLITVPTGSGKTLIAEAAIFEALCKGQTVWYTSPLVALTEQKFDEFRERFGPDNVGMVTGNKRINAGAKLIVAVTEILTNRLLVPVEGKTRPCDVVVFDEFHYFNDVDRGWVWESACLLLPGDVKLMMLSATVSKTVPFIAWLDRERGRKHKLIESTERKVPLTYVWHEQLLEDAVRTIIERDHAPCLIFAFDRVGCFATANQLTSLPTGTLLSDDEQKELQTEIGAMDFNRGAGRKFRKLLFKGIGVHHAGVLPKWRHIVESLFTRKLLKFVVCTETLAAGVNLPARTVLLPELVKYAGGARKQILPAATAQQIFGRAGRPQFDDKGYVYALAPRDEVKIKNWEKRIEKLGRTPTAKELSKKPRRDEQMVRWTKEQFVKLREAAPAPLESQALPGYGALVFMMQERELRDIFQLLKRKFAQPSTIRRALGEVGRMLTALEALEYIETEPDPEATPPPPDDPDAAAGAWATRKLDHVNLEQSIVSALADDFENLLDFRGVHPLFAHWLSKRMQIASLAEKLAVLESLTIQAKSMAGPELDRDMQEQGPLLESVGERIAGLYAKDVEALEQSGAYEGKDPEMVRREKIAPVPWFLAGKLRWEFDHLLPEPEQIRLQPKEIARPMVLGDTGFFDFIEKQDLAYQEGGIYRYLLRLVLLARQFGKLTGHRDYARIEYEILSVLEPIDPTYLAEWQDDHGIRVEVQQEREAKAAAKAAADAAAEERAAEADEAEADGASPSPDAD